MAKTSNNSSGVTGAIVAEVFGTFVLTAAVLSTVYVETSAVTTPIVAGLTLTLLVLTIGGISGAHVNPAVTFGMLSANKIKLDKAIGYWVAQFAGAILALLAITQLADTSVANQLPPVEDSFHVLAAEVLGTALFLFGIMSVVKQGLEGFSLAFGVGFSLLVGILVASVASGGVLNPAISVALTDVVSVQWEYILAPFIGALAGVYGHRVLSEL